MNSFINRRDSLALLSEIWDRTEAQFLVVYGRRRVGKTALLNAFAQKKSLLHWIAYRATSKELLQDFSSQIYPYLNDGEKPEEDFTYGSWKVALESLAVFAQKKKERVGIIIDEFPYLVEAEASFPSLLQAVWDGKFKSANIFFAISGSCIGMMKEEVLMPKGPLYGRATGIVNLQPIDFFKLGEFFPKYSPVQLVEVYGITGGVPKYFEFISDGGPVLSNIEHAIKSRSTLLTAEADFLLHEEFRETRIYLACLRALGNGPLEVGHIAKIVGIDSKVLSKYFEQLIELKFIERRVPTGEDPAKSRKGRYAICDPFLRFYFRFITPHLQEIEKGQFNQILTCIRKEFDAYIGKHVFEKICRDWLSMRADKGKFSFVPEDIGSYWDKDIEIDILGINHHDQVMVVGEAKWTNEKVGADVISELEAKSKLLQGKKDYYCHLAVFSRSGFSSKVLEIAAKKNILLVSLKEMFGD